MAFSFSRSRLPMAASLPALPEPGTGALLGLAAAVALGYGKGKVVLLGFRAQHRAQTPATYPFVFNALYWSTAK